jgi:hypothetical protein
MIHLRHRWEAREAHVYESLFQPFVNKIPVGEPVSRGDVTTVLWRCRVCPEVRTTDLEGKWTLDDIAGAPR